MYVSDRIRQPSSLITVLGTFSPFFFWKKRNRKNVSDLIMAPFEAVRELERRRQDPTLQKKVEEYLAGDIPDYFKDGPILYLARHIVTPNFETLRFIHLTEHLGLKTVITQDSKGVFVAFNQVKKALGKLPICLRVTQRGGKLNEHYQNVRIINFDAADGKPFSDIETLWGEKLIDFHARMFLEFPCTQVKSPDDAAWIDRHHRDNLLEHYKHLLALFVVHGIFFENYNTDDEHEILFVKQVLRPACNFIEQRFGYRPIISEVFPTTFESYRFWISYPRRILDIIRESMNTSML